MDPRLDCRHSLFKMQRGYFVLYLACFIGLAVLSVPLGLAVEDCISKKNCTSDFKPVCGSSQYQDEYKTFFSKCDLEISVECDGEDVLPNPEALQLQRDIPHLSTANKKSKEWTNFVIGAKVKTPHFQWPLNYKWMLPLQCRHSLFKMRLGYFVLYLACFIGLAVGDSFKDCISKKTCKYDLGPICGRSDAQDIVKTFSSICDLDNRVECAGEDWRVLKNGRC
ncbi:unnamed protein product [Nezara viridula]|uniref:Uncharacterized protein n=1 Tax=Nezara viridula TaxID=85310 RepID=A0A9P0HQE2_NEZVI|nr:unnamed protein product [Nezara viridula]